METKSKNKMKNKNEINMESEIKKLNKYKMIKKLGQGLSGTVYLIEDLKTKTQYAYKIQKIFENDLSNNFKSSIIRQIDFKKNIIDKYPNHFMNLIDHYITHNCKHQLNYNIEKIPKDYKEKAIMRRDSSVCVHYIYTLIDYTIIDYILSWEKFDYTIFYDLFLQILYVITILHSHGYIHNDLHGFNIGLKRTKDKYIDILGHKIKTHGHYVQIIDFDKVLHQKYYKNDPSLEETYRYSTDLLKLIYSLIPISSYFYFLKKYPHIEPKAIQTKTYIPKNIINELNSRLTHIPRNERVGGDYVMKMLQTGLLKIYYYDYFQKSKFKVKPMNIIYPIATTDIDYIVSYIYEPEIVLKHFLQNQPLANFLSCPERDLQNQPLANFLSCPEKGLTKKK